MHNIEFQKTIAKLDSELSWQMNCLLEMLVILKKNANLLKDHDCPSYFKTKLNNGRLLNLIAHHKKNSCNLKSIWVNLSSDLSLNRCEILGKKIEEITALLESIITLDATSYEQLKAAL